MNCKKCGSPKTVILRQKDYYCDDCFLINTNHKFRACLGKNKIITPNANVLICLSGDLSSTVLLDLVHYGISLEHTKKLRIVPVFLHVFDERTTASFVIKQCNKYNFSVYTVHFSDYLQNSLELQEKNVIPEVNSDLATQYQEMLNSMTPTAAHDFLLKIQRMLFVKYAKLLKCNFVFTAETSKTLASRLLSNIAVGRGSQVQYDIGFSDTRDQDITILRPIRDLSEDELNHYVKIKQLEPFPSTNEKNINSLQTVINSFVCNLQENFSSTISTVCKTADKIGVSDDRTPEKCVICESNFTSKNLQQLSALEATSVSRSMSFQNSHSTEPSSVFDNDNHTAVFPYVHKYLCYGCSRNHSEMDQSNLPQKFCFS